MDSINKHFLSTMIDGNYTNLNGTFSVSNGKITGGEYSNEDIPASGTIPTSGTLTYENNVLKSGCLVMGEYAVTFNPDKTTNTEKGECSQTTVLTMDEMCPGCKFIYTTDNLTRGTSTVPAGATNDYTTLTEHQYFLGLISNPSTGVIERAFACGIEGTTPFCLEGNDTTKWSDGTNAGILNTIFPSCNASASNSDADCRGGLSVNAYAGDNGNVGVIDGDGYGNCSVGNNGGLHCSEY